MGVRGRESVSMTLDRLRSLEEAKSYCSWDRHESERSSGNSLESVMTIIVAKPSDGVNLF